METIKKKFLVFHGKPHDDEAVSRLILQRLFSEKAERVFPGISTARMQSFVLNLFPKSKTEKDFEAHLFVGCGKGEYDEHHINRREGCAATIIADAIGVLRFEKKRILRPKFQLKQRLTPEDERQLERKVHFWGLRKTLDTVMREDKNGTCRRNQHEIAMMIKLLHSVTDEETVMQWAMLVRQAEVETESRIWRQRDPIQRQVWKAVARRKASWLPLTFEEGYLLLKERYPAQAKEWYELGMKALEARRERRAEAKKIVEQAPKEKIFIRGKEGQPWFSRMLVITSDNDQIPTAAFQLGVSIIIKQNAVGNVAIMTRRSDRIDLRRAVESLRRREQELKGEIKITDWKELQQVDTIPEIPEWHLMDTAGQNKEHIFNGSDAAASAVEPTRIPLHEIAALVRAAVEVKFPPKDKLGMEDKGKKQKEQERSRRDQSKPHEGYRRKDFRPRFPGARVWRPDSHPTEKLFEKKT